VGLPSRRARPQQPDNSAAHETAAFKDLYRYSVREQPRSIRDFGQSRATKDDENQQPRAGRAQQQLRGRLQPGNRILLG
ncbi:MAG TPA: hypothetical protein VGK96_11965, partial [Candidatus Sulfotelmatobacter sp.]